MFLESVPKDEIIGMSEGALYSLLSIVMVFAILLIIIGVTELVFKITGLFDLKKELDQAKLKNDNNCNESNENKSVDITDDDMMAAVLVATIDYRNEIKKDVRVVSVKQL